MNCPVIFDLDSEERLTKDMTHSAVNKSCDGARPEQIMNPIVGELHRLWYGWRILEEACNVVLQDSYTAQWRSSLPWVCVARMITYGTREGDKALGGITEAAQLNKGYRCVHGSSSLHHNRVCEIERDVGVGLD